MLYLESPRTDPYFNLALEQYLFDTVGQTQALFMLWQNANTIVVGKHQNACQEVNADFVREQGIRVVRRLSGGGAVYHDLGNLNFTFIAAAEDAALDLRLFCQPVARALGELGVAAEISGRNDITVDGRKVSGNAQYRKNGRVMHHGTILFDSDLEVVGRALNVPKDKIESKGVQSVRSRVTNLRPYLPAGVTLEAFKGVLARSVLGEERPARYELTDGDLRAVEALRESRYATWAWNWGASPKYSVRKERRVEGVGRLELYLAVKGGALTGLEVFGDFFGEGDADALSAALTGCPMEEAAVLRALEGLDLERQFHNLGAAELARIIVS